MNNLRNCAKFRFCKFPRKFSKILQNMFIFCHFLHHFAKFRQNFIQISPKNSDFHWKNRKIEWKMNWFFSFSQKKETIFNWIFEIGAVQKSVNLVDLEKCSRLRLLSRSEASIQPITSLSKFDWNFIHFSIHSLVATHFQGRRQRAPALRRIFIREAGSARLRCDEL